MLSAMSSKLHVNYSQGPILKRDELTCLPLFWQVGWHTNIREDMVVIC